MLPYVKTCESEVIERLRKATIEDAMASIRAHSPGMADLLNLVSPAAHRLLPEMRGRAGTLKKMHFGRTIKIYTPLYISNHCVNKCRYCGFQADSQAERRRLTMDELIAEANAIRGYGIDSLLLVSGEDPKHVTVDFLEEAARHLRHMFSYLAIEIAPLNKIGYDRLFKAGIDGLTLYQETYDRKTYKTLHPAGPKADYDGRLQHLTEGAEAGFRTLGIGVLLGLYDWRIESFSLAAHALWLRKKFWKSKIQFSFPRITRIEGGFTPASPLSTDDLEQMVLAFRIVFPESEISISTRESSEFRDAAAITAASTVSAASSVVPGGYLDAKRHELGQFSLNDIRSVEEISDDLSTLGLDVVCKDWDSLIAGTINANRQRTKKYKMTRQSLTNRVARVV
ncbi:MAG: 2-iminoacetate synthase ThiH [Victivallales bacterium]|nr:2-iminoacetate synthase ThiH [Victivallales bacterium]